jgi:Zn-dependent metalloprotease
MLEKIAERGTPAQREMALRTLTSTEQFRGQRQIMAQISALIVPMRMAGKQRAVYDAQNGSSLPGRLVRSEGEPASGDLAVDEAYDGSGATYDLYHEVYGRASIDDRGMQLDSTVHYQQGYDNAFWNGHQMVYGDGDEDLPAEERLFNRFTIAIDIIGHELTHGVTQYEARLRYWEQPGALNESFSDVFGSLVKQRVLGQTAEEADWLIGAGLFTPNVNGQGIRSMKAPGTAYDDPVLGKDPQPAHMRDYQDVDYDNGGVHINSGIPNHAFYVTAREIGRYAWEKAGQIWYVTLRDRLDVRSEFQDAARLTFEVAGEFFGAGSLEQKAVRKGWDEVGLAVDGGGEEGGCLAALLALLRPKARA